MPLAGRQELKKEVEALEQQRVSGLAAGQAKLHRARMVLPLPPPPPKLYRARMVPPPMLHRARMPPLPPLPSPPHSTFSREVVRVVREREGGRDGEERRGLWGEEGRGAE